MASLGVARSSRVLDFGCGAGQVVQLLLHEGYDAYGADVFYEGGSYRAAAAKTGLMGDRIREMRDSKLAFADGTFDAVISNQVLEHVDDLYGVLSEIARVLRPGGTMLSLFPSRKVWREGHVGIPFLHWMPRSSPIRLAYATAMRAVGFGYFKSDKSIRSWAKDACEWIDRFTYYRTDDVIFEALNRHFCSIKRLEPEYLAYRAGCMPLLQPIAVKLSDWRVGRMLMTGFVERFGCLVLAGQRSNGSRDD
jgi:SAM-dependent methyltransferase